jgi:isopenicillin N synthase-like dioxygenase
MHGPNLWPEEFHIQGAPSMKATVLAYLTAVTQVAQRLFRALAVALGLSVEYFDARFTQTPTTLFRIFNYPLRPDAAPDEDVWGVREHTDYGFLTLLLQDLDGRGGLEVLTRAGEWIQAPPVQYAFVVNLGDMLEIWTHGLYRATPHRVRYPPLNWGPDLTTFGDRLSFPFFFDPHWHASIEPIAALQEEGDRVSHHSAGVYQRWDQLDLRALPTSKYGEFLWSKVSKCFPHLASLAPSLPPARQHPSS